MKIVWKPQYTFIALVAIVIIGVVILIKVMFSGNNNSTNKDLINQLIAAKDSVIKKEADKVVLYERLIEEKEKTNDVLQSRDSVLNAHYNETEKLYKDINAKINSIPGRIARISNNNDSLRLLLSNY